MAPVRVLQFADLVNRHDFIDNIVRHADPDAFPMEICTLGRPSNIEDPGYAEAGIADHVVWAPTRWHYPSAVIRLAALLHRRRVDVVHAHHYEPCVIAAAATLLRPRTRLVVGRHYSDAIYLHTVGWRRRAMLGIERLVNRRAARVVVPSTRIATLLVGDQGLPPDKVALVPYGFDPAKYQPVSTETVLAVRATLGMEDRFTIATFARLYVDKGHRFVIDALPGALAAVPRLKYLVVGEGEERPHLARQVAELGLEGVVTFLGWRHDVPELMAAVDVVVQPSLQEAFSQSMAEALFMGRPLVITDVSAAQELVPDDRVGVVVPARDSAAIERAIIELAGDGVRRAALADAARSHALDSFTIERAVPLYEAVYRRACDRTRKRVRDLRG
ncbi:MAG: glycosyltransferase [Acidimicrobiales bacterium]